MPEFDKDFSAKIAGRLFDLYENECKSRSEFVAKLFQSISWSKTFGEIDAEKIAEIIWECMDTAADHYFEDVE